MKDLANCPRCGNLFVKAFTNVCNDCKRELDKHFETVYKFIKKRDNRMATMKQVVEATGVSEEDITRFVKEGRLKTSQFPNLDYGCEQCGTRISEGRLCDSCRGQIDSGLKAEAAEKEVAERQEKEEHEKANRAYGTLNRYIDKGNE
ncbi:flagellar operon protein (TIGR03826 family) [Salsuginibacillus halophilus]|uniref:Flagellar operon protein (TIGR03826 family) n=1 Tax=Salsuginibacillus halophilus TaxID=517424 RepID=A0A2P8HQR8_9BACI|nr:TIGR03826 family flagellar region protein [Salsuginibacillus halophilus]PSL48568.1 flagellar operon protein (TIGR03826 family) [Salsuginibacillus halophilus]